MKKEYPLVLLHVTLLPIPLHYSQEVMESVLPPSILENWKTLQEKATDTVLERGILIPHPKEDYDLLEERLLESLELKIPRILKCGHFHLSPEEEADILADSDTEDPDEDATDLDICDDCGRRIRDGKFGSAGSGNKRWDIKLFAANGLMRAGAWSAAWREMERVDVEILPWMEEEMKRELELRKEEEERVTLEDKEREEGVGGLDDERLREIYGGEARAFVDGKIEETDATVEMAARQMDEAKQREGEVPLWDLLREFVNHAVRDRRNVAISLLSFTVLLLSIRSFGGGRSSVTDIQPERPFGRSRTSVPIAAVQSTAGGFTASTLATMPVVDASPVAAAATSTTTTEQPQSEEGEGEEESILSAWMEAGGDEVSEMVED